MKFAVIRSKVPGALAVAAVFVLAACSSDDADIAGEPQSAPTVDSATTDSATVDTIDGGEDSESGATTPDTSTTTTPDASAATTLAPAIVEVIEDPGLADDGFVGARSDTTLDRCETVDGRYEAAGEITNSSGADATYRVYVSFNPADSALSRGLVQVDLDVTDGSTESWVATLPIDEDGLECILRVERVAVVT